MTTNYKYFIQYLQHNNSFLSYNRYIYSRIEKGVLKDLTYISLILLRLSIIMWTYTFYLIHTYLSIFDGVLQHNIFMVNGQYPMVDPAINPHKLRDKL